MLESSFKYTFWQPRMKKEFENHPFKSRIIKVLDWWYHFTSLSGVTQTRDTDCKLSKASWFVFAILGFGLTCYLVTNCVEGYYAYLTETTIEISSPLEVEFPAVTICNENRVHCGNLYNLIVNCTKVNIGNGIIVSILKLGYVLDYWIYFCIAWVRNKSKFFFTFLSKESINSEN